MNRNQKIGIGCGVVGCLGLIVIAICVVAFLFWRSQQRPPGSEERTNRNFNFNTNSNSNSNSNSESNNNSESSNTSSDEQASSFSDDDKHKLFQAASMTGDADVTQKVYKRIGIIRADGVAADGYQDFIREHANWALANREFIISVSTPEKARAYVDAHLED